MTVRNFNQNGELIPDISKVKIPPEHRFYDVMRAIIKEQQGEAAKKQ